MELYQLIRYLKWKNQSNLLNVNCLKINHSFIKSKIGYSRHIVSVEHDNATILSNIRYISIFIIDKK